MQQFNLLKYPLSKATGHRYRCKQIEQQNHSTLNKDIGHCTINIQDTDTVADRLDIKYTDGTDGTDGIDTVVC